MPEAKTSRALAVSTQLELMPSARQLVSLDEKSRKSVVDVLARLLLEAADAGAERGQPDDRA